MKRNCLSPNITIVCFFMFFSTFSFSQENSASQMEKSDVSPDQKSDLTLEVDQMNHHPRVIEMKRNDVLNDSEEMKITEDQGWFTGRGKN